MESLNGARIILAFARSFFLRPSSAQGQNPKLPHRNMADRFTSISGHIERACRDLVRHHYVRI
jgi:hypothetical protein